MFLFLAHNGGMRLRYLTAGWHNVINLLHEIYQLNIVSRSLWYGVPIPEEIQNPSTPRLPGVCTDMLVSSIKAPYSHVFAVILEWSGFSALE